MNIWHDISPELITPERFMAVIEIKKGGKCAGCRPRRTPRRSVK